MNTAYAPQAAAQKLVIDTNIALDILVFQEPKVAQLKADLAAGRVRASSASMSSSRAFFWSW